MAGLCWVTVMLAFSLSAVNSLAAVDQNRLARIVDGILEEYETKGMFSLAVSIPENQNQNTDQILQEVFRSDPGNNVRNKINNGGVYIGSRVVAAKVLRRLNGGADHAESRVVDHLNRLHNSRNANDMLLFYVYASPCIEKCSSETHHENILRRINHIRQWRSYAVVFSKIFIPKNHEPNTDQQRREALQRLGMYQVNQGSIGLDNIFRCDGPPGQMQCTSCSSDNQVADYCVQFQQPQQGNRKGRFGQGGSGREGGMDEGEGQDEGSSSQRGRMRTL
ncbi:uncharacterized protein LOC122976658 [Thunnus albacares]|uniref:uncharacterized protein LOC122976658 n=1 Tax=Thunnus albacares TaxID=8236 RepID=UPI001CF6763D|nr:uncharacterized protein LOC122976658 [Thunnus albacares]